MEDVDEVWMPREERVRRDSSVMRHLTFLYAEQERGGQTGIISSRYQPQDAQGQRQEDGPREIREEGGDEGWSRGRVVFEVV